jgi:AmmeMemoRadiSam system protein A
MRSAAASPAGPPDSGMLAERDRRTLLNVAWQSLRHGVEQGISLSVDPAAFEPPLNKQGASFVTLHHEGELRGCIGSLEAFRALISDVAENAFAAAFRDPRFPPLRPDELGRLSLDISVLSLPEPMRFDAEADLVQQLRPHRDGLILQAEGHRGTFLPSVWESLPEPGRFLQHLKLKAGLPPGYWSGDIRVWRYSTESFGGSEERPADGAC